MFTFSLVAYMDLRPKIASAIWSNKIAVLITQYEVYCCSLDNPFSVWTKPKMFCIFTWFIYLFIVLQKFFDLERENACITKEQRNHTFPRLNRNKYMVTDGAAYIGRCQGCEVPQRIMQVSGNPAALCCTPWRGSPCQWVGVPKVRKQEREGKELFNQTSYLWLGS